MHPRPALWGVGAGTGRRVHRRRETFAETPLDTYVLADVCLAAGLPDGVVNIVAADGEAGEHLVRHPGVENQLHRQHRSWTADHEPVR